MVKLRIITILCLFFACIGCKKAHDVHVFWYLDAEKDEIAISSDSTDKIVKSYDKFLAPLGEYHDWQNDNYVYCRSIIIRNTTESQQIQSVTAAAQAAHLALGDNYMVNGWEKCIMTVTLQEDGYPPINVFSHDYSVQNAQ